MQAITKLLHLAPSTAILLTQDKEGATISEEEVPAALIQCDDLLKVCKHCCMCEQSTSVPCTVFAFLAELSFNIEKYHIHHHNSCLQMTAQNLRSMIQQAADSWV